MLVIRQAQMEVFQRKLFEQFVEDTVSHLLEHFPDPCASTLRGRDGVRDFVKHGVEKAAGLHVDTPAAVTTMLELWLQFGEDFERSPIRVWTGNMLSHPDLPGTAKADVIRDRHLELTGGCVMVVY